MRLLIIELRFIVNMTDDFGVPIAIGITRLALIRHKALGSLPVSAAFVNAKAW